MKTEHYRAKTSMKYPKPMNSIESGRLSNVENVSRLMSNCKTLIDDIEDAQEEFKLLIINILKNIIIY